MRGAAVAVLGIGLRIFSAARFPFEQDELYTIDEATNLFHTRLSPGIQARPVFFFLEHPFVTRLPTAEPWLRMVALVFGIAGLWALWRFARSAMSAPAATVALLLCAISPWHLYASAFARYYSLLFLLTALAYRLLPRAYDTDAPRHHLAAALVILAGAWTHPSFVFPVAGAVLAVTVIRRDGSVGWRWPSPRAWRYLYGPLVAGSAVIAAAVHLASPERTTVANGGQRGLAATLRLVPAMVDWMTLTVAAAGLVGTWALLRSPDAGRRRLGAMVLLGGAGTVLALFSLSFFTAIYADYGIAALPLVLVAAAFAVEWLAEALPVTRRTPATLAAALVLTAGIVPSTLSYLSDGTRFDYRPAFARIRASGPATQVLTWPIVLQRRYAPRLRATELPTDPAALTRALTARGDLWVVTSVKRYGIVGDDTGGVAHWLEDNCRQVDSFQRPRLDYRVYRVDLWRCTLDHSTLRTDRTRT